MFLALTLSGIAFLTLAAICVGRYIETFNEKKKKKYFLRGTSSLILAMILLYFSYKEYNNKFPETSVAHSDAEQGGGDNATTSSDN